MSRTFASLLTHVVFSTKDREPFIVREMKSELYAYLGGLTRGIKGKSYGIDGTSDLCPHANQLAAGCVDR